MRRLQASVQGPDLAQLQHLSLLLSVRGSGTSDAGQGREKSGKDKAALQPTIGYQGKVSGSWASSTTVGASCLLIRGSYSKHSCGAVVQPPRCHRRYLSLLLLPPPSPPPPAHPPLDVAGADPVKTQLPLLSLPSPVKRAPTDAASGLLRRAAALPP